MADQLELWIPALILAHAFACAALVRVFIRSRRNRPSNAQYAHDGAGGDVEERGELVLEGAKALQQLRQQPAASCSLLAVG